MWIRDILPEFAAIVAIALWSFLMTPLLFRLFGVPISVNPMKRAKLKWDLRQSLLFGVLVWGVGMAFFDLTEKYVTWKLSGIPSDQPTLATFGGLALQWMLGGALFGFVLAYVKSSQNEDHAPPSLR